jgi:hypothetical protein
MATVADFQDRFPEFCEEEDPRVQLFLDDAALLMNSQEKWLDFYDVAHQYLAAHLLTLASSTETGDSGILAPIKRQEVDDVVIEQAIDSVKVSKDDLYSTSYGKSYIRYQRIVFAGIYGV